MVGHCNGHKPRSGYFYCRSAGHESLDKKLQPYVDESNSRLPAIVAPSVRQERDSVFNGVLTHSYTILAKTAAELIKSNLAATQRPLIFPSICNDPYTGRMLREGVTFRYMYFGKDGKPAAQLVFFPSDCSFVSTVSQRPIHELRCHCDRGGTRLPPIIGGVITKTKAGVIVGAIIGGLISLLAGNSAFIVADFIGVGIGTWLGLSIVGDK